MYNEDMSNIPFLLISTAGLVFAENGKIITG